MKPIVSMETKKDLAMQPVQMMEPSVTEKKGVTSRHVLIAVTCLIAVSVVVAGFVLGFYLMKQTSDKHSDNMTQVARMRIHNGKEVINENITVNKKEQTTEYNVKNEDGQETVVYNDFKKGLSVMKITSGSKPVCYVSLLNKTHEPDPESVEQYMKTHPNPDVDASGAEQENYNMTPADSPISDSGFLGTRINEMCEGRDIYWMYPQPTTTQNKELEEPGSRQKRATCVVSICRYCYYIRINGKLYIRCIYFRCRICYGK